MTQEENAKAYTELINRLEDVKNAIKKQNYGIAMDILYKPYPEYQITTSTELKECEDLRITKAIKYGLDHVFTNNTTVFEVTKEQCLSWLEKQGEQKQELLTKEKALKNSPFVEQKSAEWSEYDQSNFCELRSFIVETYRAEDASKLITWLESLKDRVQPQPKQEWSEEDEFHLKSIESTIEYCKKEVAENDEARYLFNEDLNWLKSLKERYTWKPSEEQMNALNYVVNLMASSERPTENDLYYNILKSLRQQLMKLKE